MSIVPTLRKMLAAQNPARSSAPIWFTEIGRDAATDEPSQAVALIKAYTMGVAQGVTRINWFEGKDGDSGPMGLLRGDGTPRPAYTAMSVVTHGLGPAPQYKGWVLLNNKHYGFVFQRDATTVMAAWTRPGTTDHVAFGSPVEIVDTMTGNVTKADACSLTATPVLVAGLAPSLLAQAIANNKRPFPWGGDYTHAEKVAVTMGNPNTEQGLHHLSSDATSTVLNAFGGPTRYCGKGAAQSFTVNPNFLSYTTVPITITAVLRRNAANDNAGFNLWYESTTGWKGTGSWYTIPSNAEWHTKTWTINDPQFVGKWGVNFSFNSDSPAHSKYYIQSVTVSKAK